MSPKNRSIIYRKTTSTVTTSPTPPSPEPTTSPIPVERAYSTTPTPTSPFPSTVDRYRPKERQIPISTINEEEEGQEEMKIERSFIYEKVYEDSGRSSKREVYKTTETAPKKYGLTAKSISVSPSPIPTIYNGYTNGYINGTKTPEKTYTTTITTTIEKKEPKKESQQISIRLGDDYPNSSMSRMSIKSRHDEEWKNFLREAREFLGVTDDRDFDKLEREEEIVEEMVEEVGPRTEGRTIQEMTEYRKESSPSPSPSSWTRTVQKMEKKTMY